MLQLFYVACYSFSVTECNGLNTYLDGNKCKCRPGYPYGDPLTLAGCYFCQDTCHQYGYCSFPGKCQCLKGLVGDGIHNCYIPIPIIQSVSPQILSPLGNQTLEIRYGLETAYVPESIFCKFGDAITIGKFLKHGELTCPTPPSFYSAVRFSISFDTQNFSTTNVFLRYNQEDKDTYKIDWTYVAMTVIAYLMLNRFIKKYEWSQRVFDKHDQLKSHVHNPQIHAFKRRQSYSDFTD